ncbi:MAG TPA: SET domain-containing protein [Rhodanobacteraceae bacterium]|nr:SET domain-containing protein [Rhodanobacteraceae bacterium]
MILPRYRISASTIPGAGLGLFMEEPVPRGRVVVAPDGIAHTHDFEELYGNPELAAQLHSAARWFEDRFTLSPEWPDECYVNHDFSPNGLWHLGFVFAARNLAAGEELTVDYRHLLAPGQEETFRDARTGSPIVGLPWRESLLITSRTLAALLA